ncbi:hypothetical protein GCM10025881_32640 [Pseudolysinimonas kribbensis]|uniref:Uncharacterized protein n=1 Tax=Pseudolysinimonas kribbensis TaxID=433641 RepID=A0ABQ6KA25_9MICO|nr:hypothetical protein GCM10025881_32640 [Pseudolysinimonas kribbensis]
MLWPSGMLALPDGVDLVDVDLVTRDAAGQLVLGQLRDPAGVPLLAAERLADERVDESERDLGRVLPGADRDEVRVVVLAGQQRRVVIPDQRGPGSRTLFAAICSPLPEPPNTTPSASTPDRWSWTTASAVLMQKLG